MKRKDTIKKDILQRLGLDEVPENPPNNLIVPVEILKKYEAVKVAQDLDYVHKPCAVVDFHTQELIPLSTKEVKKFKPNPNSAVGDDCISE